MEIKQETKSLPRNRKCGNCRYFEPAPLWRKGWCRNPRLYDRRANHLVDAATIDCEQVFRARIYWEPVPIAEISEPASGPGYSPFVGQAGETGQADGGRNRPTSPNQEGVLRPRALNNNPQAKFNENGNLPVITRRERSTASPGIVASPSKTRRWLVENIPYYDKIDGPISRLNISRVLLGVFIVALVLIVLMLALGGKKGTTDATNQPSTTDSASSGLVFGNTTPSVAVQPTASGNNKSNATATPTLSNQIPTATAVPTVAPTTKVIDATAKVVNVGSKGLNLRKDPGKNGAIISHVPENETITITSADYKKIDGIEWWPISYKGTAGWVDAEYLQKN